VGVPASTRRHEVGAVLKLRPMRIIYSLAVVLVLFLAVAIKVIFTASRPDSAIGLAAVVAMVIEPVYLALYIGGFALTYWMTSKV
jgi:hypothetical protein